MDRQVFANHAGVTPMLWVLTGLATLETFAVHLFVALKWPWIGWPLTMLSAASVAWLVSWIRSWRRLPHTLADGVLTLHMGSLRQLAIRLCDIRLVSATVNDTIVKARTCRNLVPVAYPNRVIFLRTPLVGKRQVDAIAIRLDDPAAFDAALRYAAIEVVG